MNGQVSSSGAYKRISAGAFLTLGSRLAAVALARSRATRNGPPDDLIGKFRAVTSTFVTDIFATSYSSWPAPAASTGHV